MKIPIITFIGFCCALLAIILIIINIYKSKKNEEALCGKTFVLSMAFMGLFVLSFFLVKYEIKYYVDNGYILMKSVPSFTTPKYEPVEYDNCSSNMYDYIFKIDKKTKIIYINRKGR